MLKNRITCIYILILIYNQQSICLDIFKKPLSSTLIINNCNINILIRIVLRIVYINNTTYIYIYNSALEFQAK